MFHPLQITDAEAYNFLLDKNTLFPKQITFYAFG